MNYISELEISFVYCQKVKKEEEEEMYIILLRSIHDVLYIDVCPFCLSVETLTFAEMVNIATHIILNLLQYMIVNL